MIKAVNIKEVIEMLVKVADEERSKDTAYKDLFKNHEGIEGLLRDTAHRMTSAVLDACQILEKKYKMKITNEIFKVLLGLPLFEDFLEKHITNLEGFVCSVDKTYYLLSEIIKKEFNEGKEGIEGDIMLINKEDI